MRNYQTAIVSIYFFKSWSISESFQYFLGFEFFECFEFYAVKITNATSKQKEREYYTVALEQFGIESIEKIVEILPIEKRATPLAARDNQVRIKVKSTPNYSQNTTFDHASIKRVRMLDFGALICRIYRRNP